VVSWDWSWELTSTAPAVLYPSDATTPARQPQPPRNAGPTHPPDSRPGDAGMWPYTRPATHRQQKAASEQLTHRKDRNRSPPGLQTTREPPIPERRLQGLPRVAGDKAAPAACFANSKRQCVLTGAVSALRGQAQRGGRGGQRKKAETTLCKTVVT